MMTAEPAARADGHQRLASDPATSAFVDASAGAGKTKLLTDRILRLMLAGTDPGKILCLTYTRAAAAEMALRLNAVLADWVRLGDDALAGALARLGVSATPAARAAARQLFARVLELPGGMRISTIHAFCQSVLRRFPLEAGLSPHFRLIEDGDAAAAMAASREAALAGIAGRAADEAALDHLAAFIDESGFSDLIGRIGAEAGRLAAFHRLGPEGQLAALRRVFGLTVADEGALLAGAVQPAGEDRLRESLQNIAERGSPAVRARAVKMLDWLALSLAERAAQDGGVVWIDMEGSAYTERTVVLYERLKAAHANTGICLQAYLRRTAADIQRLLPLEPAIRLVKGAYDEPVALAYRSRREVDANYAALAMAMLEARAAGRAIRIGIGTHDVALIEQLAVHAAALGLPRTAFEVQMLYGIRMDQQRRLAHEGYTVRDLVAYGTAWYPWYMRRLAERPANVLFALRQIVG